MRKVSIGFSRPTKFAILSWLIQTVQKTDYSHVYIKFYSSSYDRNIIYQASGLQVNFIGEQLFQEHHVVSKEFEFDVSEETYKKMMAFAIDRAGYPYSIKQLFNIAGYMITGKTLLSKDGRDSYVCSELASQMMEEDLKIPLDKDLDLITPKDVYVILDGYKNGKTR